MRNRLTLIILFVFIIMLVSVNPAYADTDSWLSSIYNYFTSVWNSFLTLVSQIWTAFYEFVINILKWFVGLLKVFIVTIWEYFIYGASKLLTLFMGLLKSLYDSIVPNSLRLNNLVSLYCSLDSNVLALCSDLRIGEGLGVIITGFGVKMVRMILSVTPFFKA